MSLKLAKETNMQTPDRYCVIGHPIAHSRSPWIHTRFAHMVGHNIVYTAEESPLEGFATTVQQLRTQGLKGANVTVPFKLQAYALAQQHSDRATLAQAANTLYWQDDGTLYADNTDGLGLVRDITVNAGQTLQGQRVLLLGAGGASAGVLGEVLAQRPALVVVANRTVSKAEALVAQHQACAQTYAVTLEACTLDAVTQSDSPLPAFDVIINGTASSLSGQALLLPPARVAPQALLYDMMYGAAAMAFLQQASTLHARARDGLGMLVEQAAAAFALWRGVTPDTHNVLHALRQRIAQPQE